MLVTWPAAAFPEQRPWESDSSDWLQQGKRAGRKAWAPVQLLVQCRTGCVAIVIGVGVTYKQLAPAALEAGGSWQGATRQLPAQAGTARAYLGGTGHATQLAATYVHVFIETAHGLAATTIIGIYDTVRLSGKQTSGQLGSQLEQYQELWSWFGVLCPTRVPPG